MRPVSLILKNLNSITSIKMNRKRSTNSSRVCLWVKNVGSEMNFKYWTKRNASTSMNSSA